MKENDNFEGFPDSECGDHRTTGTRAWCYSCSEWCYPHEGCKGCKIPLLEERLSEATDIIRELYNHSRTRNLHLDLGETDCKQCDARIIEFLNSNIEV